jgi:hypothetical protein
VRALSLFQPYASLVAIGAKRIETRSWYTRYRGELAIHASARFPTQDRMLLREEPFMSVLIAAGVPEAECVYGSRRCANWAALPTGAIVAVAQLVGCVQTAKIGATIPGHREPVYPWSAFAPHEHDFGDFGPGRWAWLLEDVRRLETPIDCRGALGLWMVPPEIETAVRQQLVEVMRV